MATHGKASRVYVNGYDLTTYLQSIACPGSADTAEVSCFGSSDKTYVAGLKTANVSAEGIFDGSSGKTDAVFNAALGTSANTWSWWPIQDTSGNPGYGGLTIQNAYEITSPVAGAVVVSAGGQISGERERLISLGVKATRTGTSGAGTSVDLATATTQGGAAYLQAFSVTGVLTASILHSNNNSTFDALVTFSNSSGLRAERKAFTGTRKRYVKYGWSWASTGDSASLQIGIH